MVYTKKMTKTEEIKNPDDWEQRKSIMKIEGQRIQEELLNGKTVPIETLRNASGFIFELPPGTPITIQLSPNSTVKFSGEKYTLLANELTGPRGGPSGRFLNAETIIDAKGNPSKIKVSVVGWEDTKRFVDYLLEKNPDMLTELQNELPRIEESAKKLGYLPPLFKYLREKYPPKGGF